MVPERKGGAVVGEHSAFVIPSDVLFRDVAGEMVLLHLETEQYFALDHVGAEMVSRITDQPWDDALAALREVFDVDLDVLRSDVQDLVDELMGAGLIAPRADAD
jgi:hypothetical protein